jgi:PAS domain S-box-containing protein
MSMQLEQENAALRQRIVELEAQIAATSDSLHYRLLAENVDDVIWVLDLESGRFVYVSPSVEKLRGYTAAEVITQSMPEVITPDSLAMIAHNLPPRIAAFLAGDPDAVAQTHEIEQICKGGATIWTEVRTTLLRSEVGALQVLGVSRDISARRAVETALRRSEENLNRAQAVAHTGSWVLNLATNQLEWSQETYRIFGLPQSRTLTLEDFFACIHSEDREAVVTAWQAALQGAHYAIDHRIVVGGKECWVHEDAEFQYDAQGKPRLATGVVKDITDRKLAENALRVSEARYRVIFEGADEGILAYNLVAHRFEYVNPAMCALFGYTHAELLQLDVPNLHPEDALSLVMEEFEALVSGVKSLSTNILCQRRDGTRFYADIKAASAVIDGASLIVAFFRDVTERQRGEALLRARLHLSTLPPDATLDELLQATLDAAEIVTESKIGYFHFLDAAEQAVLLQHWSTNTLGQSCTLEGKGHRSEITAAGVWAESVRQRKAVIINDYQAWPNRVGLPAGHSPLARMISAPVIRNSKVVALIGVGDRESDYDAADVEAVTLLAAEAWDIVLRKRAEAALRESEDRYRTLVESQEAVITAVDADGVHHYINQIGAQLLKRSVADILGKRLHDLFPAQEADVLLANVCQVIASGQGMTGESPNLWDGRVRWSRTNLQPLRNANGQIAQVLISSVDITDRKAAELVLEERVAARTVELEAIRQRLELATGAAGIGIWEWNCKTDALLWDSQMYRVFGIGRSDFDDTIQGWATRLHPEDLPVQQALLQVALRREREFDSTYRICWPDGSIHHIKANAITLFDAQGFPDRMIGVNYDITLTKQAEQMSRQSEETLRRANLELERAVRMKDDFLASMSHELRTPLTGILGMAEVLLYTNYGELSERQRKAVTNIENSGRHLLDLINDILDISKIEADKLELQVEPAVLDDICQASLQLVKGLAHKKSQHIRLTMDPTGIALRCDARRVKQILVNLLSNAVKFTPEQGTLGLEVIGDANAQIVQMTVWDNGIGIAEQDLPKLFQPFVQLDSSLARQQAGTGLGLALVARLTALHGGSVTVDSAPGIGSRFTIAIPWHETTPVWDALDGAHEPELVGQHVLTVEDNELDAARLTRFLKVNGIENIVHSQGEGAVERATVAQPSVILLDINLPDASGWEVLAKLKANAQTAAIPVVITSVEEDRVRANALGAAGYLVKPISPSELRTVLERAQTPVTPREPVMVIANMQTGPVVMVVDDNQVNIDTLTDFLEANNFRIVSSHSGLEFMDRVSTVRPDIVLMDIQMPGMDGLETTRRLRTHVDPGLATIPVIALTALAMSGDRERCIAAGANEYMSKPMRLAELLATIDRLLEKRVSS